jgi:asparagine synthase (glutamine-hydrolysing)
LTDWVTGRLGDEVRRELLAFCDDTDLLDRGEVLRYLDGSPGHQTWYLLNLALWWREFVA